MSEKEKQELLDSLNNLAASLEKSTENINNQELLEMVQNIKKAKEGLAANDLKQTVESLGNAFLNTQNLNSQANQLLNELTNISASINQAEVSYSDTLNASLAQQINSNNLSNSSAANQTQVNQSGNGGKNTGNNGNGNSDSNDNGSGNGNDNGNGSGNSSGAGLGEGNHMISVPSERIESDGVTGTIDGSATNGNGETYLSGSGTNTAGISLPYEAVFKEYQENVMKSIEKEQIPIDYQDIIKEYFSSLEP